MISSHYSIVVSTLNSLATVTWEDFLSPLNVFHKRSDRFQLVFIKSLGVMYAFLTMGLAFVVSLFSGVIEISMFVNAATSGTLVGVFILAMLIPFANSKVQQCEFHSARNYNFIYIIFWLLSTFARVLRAV